MIKSHCDVWHLFTVSNRHPQGGERKLVGLWFLVVFFFLRVPSNGI